MNKAEETFEVIVVGGGHAGIEAALAASRMGARTLLLTQNLDTVGAMSCNPSIGGVAKGHIVREIDALGGEMARAADKTMLHFKMLNTSKGPAMHSPRAQCDKKLYHLAMKEALEDRGTEGRLWLRQDEASRLWIEGSALKGVVSKRGRFYAARCVVLTTGTFLNGKAHVGLHSHPAGRSSEPPARELSASLSELGFSVGRMKTGTPMRLHAGSIDFSRCQVQPSDPPLPFSHFTREIEAPMLDCHIAYTSELTHEIIRENLGRSPLYSGIIKSLGPRYCPSIEDKVVKFPHHPRHQIFLEPEGRRTREIYVNGLSTSLPEDAQIAMTRSIEGLEKAEILRFGYAIEYDFCPPTQIRHSLETKLVGGLFLAGQINGTTGYEEAAGQGLLAGINAALKARGEPPFVLGRERAYLGVMIDDLVTKGVDEPYRMFTSRAEFRLTLRQDNADLRLLESGRDLGLVGEDHYRSFLLYRECVVSGDPPSEGGISPWSFQKALDERAIERSYAGYIERERAAAERLGRLESVPIPAGLEFSSIPSLPPEAKEKLSRVRPATLGQAGRIPGLSPSDVQILWVYAEKTRRERGGKGER